METLQGHALVSNRSIWRNFPWVWNDRWWHRNIVLIGDALRTAHYSIGSGTRLAMEDALALTKALSKELAGSNILVNAVAVGKIKSKQQERNAARQKLSNAEFYEKTGKTIPIGRMGESEEVANVIAFLASDAAADINGVVLDVNGGRVMM